MVYIAYDYNGRVIDIVLAKSRELVNAYWHGKGVFPHSTEERREELLENHPTGVIPLIHIREITLNEFGRNPKKYLVVDKNG